MLDFPIGTVVERTIQRAMISYRLKESFTRGFPQPLTYMTMRDRFDHLLAERAMSAGADLKDGTAVTGIEVDDGEVRVHCNGDSFQVRVLVGADGANSTVAYQLGLLRGAEVGVGLESEVYPEPSYLEPWESVASLDFGTIRGGYMWVFPKVDHLSIGVAGFQKMGAKLRPLLDGYLRHLQLGDYQERLTRGHRLIRRRRGMPIQRGRALLVGEAAGLMDFWTGEGIYYAIRSAQASTPPILDFLEGKTPDLRGYERAIDRDLMPELQLARTLTRISVHLPRLSYTLMKNSEWVWNAGCQILRAERSYEDVRRKMGPFTFLFDLVGRGV